MGRPLTMTRWALPLARVGRRNRGGPLPKAPPPPPPPPPPPSLLCQSRRRRLLCRLCRRKAATAVRALKVSFQATRSYC